MIAIDELLLRLRGLGVEVWSDGDSGDAPREARLRYRASKEILTPSLLELLQEHKIEILAFLQQANTGDGFISAIRPAKAITGQWVPGGCQAFQASYGQSRLWFLQQLEPGLTAYHMPALWGLRGDLDLPALEHALGDLVARHSTLRTSFCLQDKEVIQIIHPPTSFSLTTEPLADRNHDHVIQTWLQQERSTPFDLTAGLLLRARLLAVDQQYHLLLINHHHIASDGWSNSVFTRDLLELYNALRSGRSPDLQPLAVHYHDYAVWQRQRLSGDRLQKLKDFWIHQLTGLQPLELPTDHPRPVTPSYRGQNLCFQIEPKLLEPFEELCRGEGATLQMGLLAAVALLLHRTSRQDEVAIGVPFWGRNHPELENLIGFFINTLPIRTRFKPGLTFRQLLALVRETSISAYDHQELPFEQMVEALNVERDTSRNPLVQVMLQLMELPDVSLEQLDGLAVQSLPTGSDSAKFDLSFYLCRSTDQGLSASITYATDLFNADRIKRLTSHLIHLLSAILEAPDAPSDSLSFLPPSERLLIETWQHGPTIDLPELCVHQLFEQQAKSTPHSLALVFEDQQLTYAELNARANQLAHHLIELDIGLDKIVAVCLERSVELIVSLLAVLKAGGAYLPLDPAWPEERLQTLLNASGACVVIVDPTTAKAFTNAPVGLRSLNIYSLAKSARNIDVNPQEASPDSLAYLLFTSGSTGSPKGVLIEHQALVHRVIGLKRLLPLHPSSRVLALTSSVFDISLLELVVPLTCGGLIVLANEQQRRNPSSIEKLLTRHQISLLQATPSMLFSLVDSTGLANSDLTILAGGEELPPPLANRLSKVCGSLLNGYGPTEATIYTSLAKVDVGNGISIGHPIAGTTVRVLNSTGQLCPIGIPGELHIGGVGLARGYLNNPVLTVEKFIPDPFSSDPTARLYKSGDLASWNPDGTLAFHGRIDQQIKLRGYRIEPGEIESHVLAHPVIAQAAVVLHSTDPADPRLIAYWVAQTTDDSSSAIPSAEQLRSFLAERLPAYMVPSAFVALDELPLTTTGKLDRKALPAPTFAADPEQRVEPSTDLEHKLHAIWAEVLGHADFGITDNFFLVGGHSLASARLVSRVNREVKLSDSLISFFKDPTIAGQANIISGSVRDPYRCLVTLQPLGQKPPIFIIHGWAGKVSQWRHLAGALAPHRPVFGLQAYGADHNLPPQGNLEEMADAYVDEILKQQPEGKINLLGHSTGGWYAFAVAGALLKRGGSIGMLAVLDTKPPWPKIHLSRDPFTALLDRYIPCKLSVHIDILAPASQLSSLQIFWSAYALHGVSCHASIDNHLNYDKPDSSADLASALESILSAKES